jgi:putative ABC transport system ATP-binding protein
MISTRQLCYRYADGPAITFDDLDVAQGGVLLLGGASGSGKSTWLALAAGLLKATDGEMTVAGQALSQLDAAHSDAWRAKTIGFLPQKLHLSAALSVAENLELAQWAAGQASDKARILDALTALGVQDLALRKPSQLSGGQAQRVALARATLLQPQVILADEPTASLDDAACEDALGLLCATAQRLSATLVIATHDARVHKHFEAAALPFLSEKLAASQIKSSAKSS